jgi:hypothetical protein
MCDQIGARHVGDEGRADRHERRSGGEEQG